MIPLTDPAALLDAYKRGAGLACRREGEGVWRVQSSRHPSLFYTVKVSEEGATCNCPAVACCRHIGKALAREFPALLVKWWTEFYKRQVKRNMARRRAFRNSLERSDAEAAKVFGTERIAA